MGAFSNKEIKVTSPDWQDGEVVYLRKKLTAAAQAEIFDELERRIPNLAELGEEALLNHKALASHLSMKYLISRWTLFDDDGNEVECTPENIALLDGDYANVIINAMSGIEDKTMTKEQEADFLHGANGRTQES